MNKELAKYIDHTALKPDTTKETIKQIVDEAREYEFASVCVNPYWVPFCYENLKDTSIKICTVIGFPLGATSTASKVFETEQAIKDGATEVDMVINVGELKSKNDEAVQADIKSVVSAAKDRALTKVIIETSLLSNDEKIRACKLAKEAGADFVKTSTGFSGGGATVEDIKLMRQTVGSEMGIKASGGVRDNKSTIEMIDAGATRIGASSGIEIVKEN
ncbi:deoxyribose-phosphate aldolase [Virgibacillus sp. NKC19-16]|uniref:deoxyribose-phosphate aldolase n=1 Tax=Virgibacillus salidurans TaxID=2831673 RepID=UPI001F1CBD9F|nr:deoxyribose-phosphate aldolase [Virgibacillus sp. NKC19-16]UJL44882.1 deoxyribose-phosphate aldolase [Virgibacillus sp. NKC19-16]